MEDNQEMDWDYYEYGYEEEKQKALMKGILKWKKNTVYTSKNCKDDKFSQIEISVDVKNLIDFGVYSKDSCIFKNSNNQRQYDKTNLKVKEPVYKATVPKEGQSTLLNKGADTRLKQGGTNTAFPGSGIGFLYVTFKNGNKFRATATMIGPNHAITAGHAVYNRTGGQGDANKIQSINYYPGLLGDQICTDEVEIVKVLLPQQYLDLQNKAASDFDLALLIFNKPLGLQTGWFGLGSFPDETLKFEKVEVAGYPIDKELEKPAQYTCKGKIDIFKPETFEYSLDVVSGQNGGPLYIERKVDQNQSEHYLIGIHISQIGDKHFGVRLSKYKYQLLKEMMEFHFIRESLDEKFYNRLVANTTEFSINFELCSNIDIKNMTDCFFALRSNQNLKQLLVRAKIKENTPFINDEAMKEFSESLKHLRKLEGLKADFFNCDLLTNDSLINLGKGIGQLKDLQSLCLTINGNNNLTNPAFRELTVSFQNLYLLNNIIIFLYNLGNLSDEGLKFIGANIGKVETVDSLKLDLQMLKKVTDKGVKEMCMSFKGLKNMKKFNLILMGVKFSDDQKKDLRDQFSFVPSLSIV